MHARLMIEADLARALAEGEFELYYQPQVTIADGSLFGAEALIRWRHPQRGLISPGEFMPIVNNSAMLDPVAAWVIRSACRQAAAWARRGHAIRVGVNLASSLIRSGQLPALIEATLRETQLPASLLELEVTEDILLSEGEARWRCFAACANSACAPCSTISAPAMPASAIHRKFPLDGLKIDRSFVMGLKADSADAAIVVSAIALARQSASRWLERHRRPGNAEFWRKRVATRAKGICLASQCRRPNSSGDMAWNGVPELPETATVAA